MTTTIRAVFDGEVLRPEEPLPLRPATTHVITVEREAPAAAGAGLEAEAESGEPSVLAEIGRPAADTGIEDPAARGAWYVHGHVADDDPDEGYPPTALGRLAMDMGVEDFAARHDWYAHGRLPDDEP